MKKLLIFCILFIFASSGFCTDYFVRDDASGTGNGLSDATAFTLAQVNAFSFAVGDDVYLKCGDTWLSQQLYVDWAGTEGNRVIIGAYYGSGTIGVSGDEPKFDGQTTYPGEETPLIHVVSSDYVTVENIDVVNSSGYGVRFRLSNYGSLLNVYINWAWNNTIAWSESDHGTIQNCTATQSDMKYGTTGVRPWGSAVGIRASEHVTIKNCLVYRNYGEGINFYQGSNNGLAEYNILYDNRAVQMYMDGDRDCVYRFNFMYGSADTTYHRYTNFVGIGIYITDEAWDGDQVTTGNEAYGNYIANCYRGIMTDSIADFTNYKLYNNDIVGCGVGLSIASDTYTTSEIINNLIWSTGNSTAVGSIPATTTGLTWSNNLWSDGVTDHPGTGDVIGDPLLFKTYGWNTITAGSLNENDFALQVGSPAIGAGVQIIGFNNLLDAEQTTLPGTVVLLNQDDFESWEIGADIKTDGAIIEDPTAIGFIYVGSLNEDIIKNTGFTINIELTNATWPNPMTDANKLTLLSGWTGSAYWISQMAGLDETNVTRTSDRVATITSGAISGFDITSTILAGIIIDGTINSSGADIDAGTFPISVMFPKTISKGIFYGGDRQILYSPTGRMILYRQE